MLNQFLYRTDKESTLNDWLSKPNAFTSADFLQFADSASASSICELGAVSLAEATRAVYALERFLLQYPQWLARSTRQPLRAMQGHRPLRRHLRPAIHRAIESLEADAMPAMQPASGYRSCMSTTSAAVAADGDSSRATAVSAIRRESIDAMNSLGIEVNPASPATASARSLRAVQVIARPAHGNATPSTRFAARLPATRRSTRWRNTAASWASPASRSWSRTATR